MINIVIRIQFKLEKMRDVVMGIIWIIRSLAHLDNSNLVCLISPCISTALSSIRSLCSNVVCLSDRR